VANEAYIVDILRTPTGKRKGSLAQIHSADLGAHVLSALVQRNGIPGEDYEDVIFGVIDAVGPQASNMARSAWLAAGLPVNVPAVTLDRQCGSSQQALHFAAQAVMSGTMDVVAAGGVQNMSAIPMGTAARGGKEFGFTDTVSESKGFMARFGATRTTQFAAAQLIAEKYGFSREAMEEFALVSNHRARAAIDAGRFDREIVPIGDFKMDETVRETSLEKMATLEPLAPGSRLTAAVSSQISDAASAALIVSEAALKRYNLKPRARIHQLTVVGDDPIMMLTAPISATRKALKKAGLSINDIDLVEINEAFSSVPMAWMKELECSHDKVNVNGGAIALGHPIGATGIKLMATLLHELERRGGRYGLQTMCEGGGLANVTIIERL
jgi:acetyl-CoA C-acetyltransferase